jgi:MFS family permease
VDTTPTSRRPWLRLWLTLFAVAFGAGVPVPLLLVYRDELGLSEATVTLAFGIYAAGLIPAVLVAGAASDRHGRRTLVLLATALFAIAGLMLLATELSPAALLAGRFVQGVASGVVFSVGSAWMQELSRADGYGRAGKRTTAALSTGFALGPLVAGLLAAWAPGPMLVPYVLYLALTAVALAGIPGTPDDAPRAPRARLMGLGLGDGAGRRFALEVVPLALWVFTLPTASANTLPVMLGGEDGSSDVALAGVAVAVTMLAGALVLPLGTRRRTGSSAGAGLLLGSLGLGLGAAAVGLDSWPLVLAAGCFLGAGYGLCLAAGLTRVELLADPSGRGALTAAFYALTYVGMAAPFVVTALAGVVGAIPVFVAGALLAAATALWAATYQRPDVRMRDRSTLAREQW